MSNSLSLPQATAQRLSEIAASGSPGNALVGFDGFVDAIIHIVDKRFSATEYSRMENMTSFGERIVAAAGLSMNFEFVTQMLKLGGNGPIMANALLNMGMPLTYVGNLGSPAIHPVFEDFNSRARVISIAEPGYTDALEFTDGKLMCGKHESLKEVTWENILAHLPNGEAQKVFAEASLIAMVNWTMLPAMTEVFRKILADVAPTLEGQKRWIFFDLADPAKRTSDDIAEVLGVIAEFEKFFNVILGLNFNESCQIGEVLGIPAPDQTPEAVAAHAASIRGKLNVHTVVVHPSKFAGAADESGALSVAGPYTDRPRITTGAGDHFNAGFCFGRLIGCDIAMSLEIGVATSGYYVRNAESPTLENLITFLNTLE